MSRFAAILLVFVLFATVVIADPIVVLDRGVGRSGGHVFWTGGQLGAKPAAGGASAVDVLSGFQAGRGAGVLTPASGSFTFDAALLQPGSGSAVTTPLVLSSGFTGLHTEGVALSRGDGGRRGGRDGSGSASAGQVASGGAGGVGPGGDGVWGNPPGGGHAYGPGGNPYPPGNAYGPGGRKNGDGNDGMNTAPVPEPASIVLMGLMLLASAGLLRRHRFNRQAR